MTIYEVAKDFVKHTSPIPKNVNDSKTISYKIEWHIPEYELTLSYDHDIHAWYCSVNAFWEAGNARSTQWHLKLYPKDNQSTTVEKLEQMLTFYCKNYY